MSNQADILTTHLKHIIALMKLSSSSSLLTSIPIINSCGYFLFLFFHFLWNLLKEDWLQPVDRFTSKFDHFLPIKTVLIPLPFEWLGNYLYSSNLLRYYPYYTLLLFFWLCFSLLYACITITIHHIRESNHAKSHLPAVKNNVL